MSKRLKTLEQVAFRLAVTEEILRGWNEITGEGPQVTLVRGQPMYHVNDVEAFVEANEREHADDTLILTVGVG